MESIETDEHGKNKSQKGTRIGPTCVDVHFDRGLWSL
jgi:hypothetical protein